MTEVRSHAASRAAEGGRARTARPSQPARATLDADELPACSPPQTCHHDRANERDRTVDPRPCHAGVRPGAQRRHRRPRRRARPANFARDRAAVHAAVELTDGGDFLERFRRTIAWQRITALAARRGVQPPDAALARLFEPALQLAAGGLPRRPRARRPRCRSWRWTACDGELSGLSRRAAASAPLRRCAWHDQSTRSTACSTPSASASSALRPAVANFRSHRAATCSAAAARLSACA